MPCSDRQLLQSQIVAGFSTRIGVQKVLRPFTGAASPENLVDYLNREVYPVVKAAREKLNEVYLPAKDQSPSANNLQYRFSASTVAADPTTGFLRLNQAVQNTATVIRLSETNSRLQNVATWLSVMQGSSTTPLGVVTLQHITDPGRFIRFNLTGMVDNGSYWDLTVTPVESSHPNPFSENDAGIVASYIAGVASGGVSLATGVAAIRGVSAGTQLLTSGTLSFANSNQVSWGLNAGTLTASFAALKSISLTQLLGAQTASITAATDSTASGPTLFLPLQPAALDTQFSFANVSYRLSGNTLLAGAHMSMLAGVSNVPAQALSFANSNGVSFGAQSTTFAGFGAVAFLTASYARELGLVSHIGGNAVSSVTRLAFSNASNVTWSLSTAAGAATVIASVAAGGGGGGIAASASIFGGSISAGTLQFSNHTLYTGFTGRASLPNVIFSLAGSDLAASAYMGFGDVGGPFGATRMDLINSNDMTFGATITSVAGSGSRVFFTGSYLPQLGVVSHVGGNVVSSATRLAFSNANNVTFSLSTAAGGATLLGSVVTSAQQTFIGGIAGGTQTATSGTIVFSNSNNVSFGLSGSTRMTAQAFQNISAGTTNGVLSGLSFVDGAGISFGLNGSSITAQFAQQIGLFSHIGGNSVANVSRLAFSNASNVTWSLSTAAQAATLIASVNAGGGAGVAISAGTQSEDTGTMVFSNSNGISFGMSGSSRITASYNPLAIGGAAIAGAGSFSAGTVSLSRGTSPFPVEANFSNSTVLFDYPEPVGGFSNGARINNTNSLPFSGLHNLPVFFQPFQGGPPLVGFNTDFRFGNWNMLMSGNFGSTNSSTNAGGGGSFAYTLKLALYSVVGVTGSQLTLVASNSRVVSTNASGSGVSNFGAGVRRVIFSSNSWDVNGPLTRGQYWAALMVSLQQAGDARASFLAETMAPSGKFNGNLGAGSVTGARLGPFWGLYTNTTAAFPASVASSHIITSGGNLSYAGILPWVSVQPTMNAAFG